MVPQSWFRAIVDDKLNLEQPVPAMPVPPARQVLHPDVLATHSAWVKASKEIVGLMLMTMDPDIQKNLEQLGAYDMLKELKTLYAQQAEHELLQTVKEFHALSLILVSLRKKYDSFVQNYNMHDMGKTVTELHAMLKLHEQTLPKKDVSPALHAIRAGKVQKKKHKNKKPQLAARGNNQRKGKSKLGLGGSWKLKPGALSLYVGVVSALRRQYEAMARRAPKLSYLKVWGCKALVKRDTLTKPDKLEPKSIKCIFIGYRKETMGYSFYYPPENKIFVAQNAEFLENRLYDQEANSEESRLEDS
ncbi:zinc finger, CCHC-type containing protein [Tanacetum coccineum]